MPTYQFFMQIGRGVLSFERTNSCPELNAGNLVLEFKQRTMNYVKNIAYKELSIIYSNLSNLDQDIAKSTMRSTVGIITKMPLKSAYSLINLDGLTLTRDLIAEIKLVGAKNTPYVKATAICGLNPMASFLANSVIKITKRNAKLFKSPEEGKAWLYQESLKSTINEQQLISRSA